MLIQQEEKDHRSEQHVGAVVSVESLNVEGFIDLDGKGTVPSKPVPSEWQAMWSNFSSPFFTVGNAVAFVDAELLTLVMFDPSDGMKGTCSRMVLFFFL